MANRASACFLRRVLWHVTACVDGANGFLNIITGLSVTCGFSKRDVSQCVGPFDHVLASLLSIQRSAAAGWRLQSNAAIFVR